MKMNMKKLQGETFQTVYKLPDGIKIKVNLHNWVLFIPPRNYSYFPTLDSLLNDLLDYKIKLYAIQSEKKDIASLKESIEKARKEIMDITMPLRTIKTNV